MSIVVDASGKFKDRSSKCPVCSNKTNGMFTPFCSKRCKDVDLGHWMTGNYYISSMSPAPTSDSRIVANDDMTIRG